MPRGVRVWNQADSTDLFEAGPPAPAIEAPAPAPRASGAGRVRTDQECRRQERAWDMFKDWLFGTTLDALKAAEPAQLAQRFAPLEPGQIVEMLAAQIANPDRDRTLAAWRRVR